MWAAPRVTHGCFLDHFGGGGTRQTVSGPPLTLWTAGSPWPLMCTVTAPAWPLSLPIFISVGVLPLASVYLMTVPLGHGPNLVPVPSSR